MVYLRLVFIFKQNTIVKVESHHEFFSNLGLLLVTLSDAQPLINARYPFIQDSNNACHFNFKETIFRDDLQD